ncbi:MAG: biosynthetic arginine decarboxylase [Gemmatimonadota bacterium]|nr:biosynthetic arginine decarboxylase [Gemmatimonadota bacterium]
MSEAATTESERETEWSTQHAADTYRFEEWGDGYLGISEQGTLVVHPTGSPEHSMDLLEIVEGLETRGLTPPVVLRFPDLLRHRMTKLRDAFAAAIEEVGYGARYSCVYPIKVNQQRQLCEAVCDVAEELDFGIEVGSKPELLAGLALTVGRNSMPLVCNGFKDDEFIETVILAAKMGRNVIPVVEQFHELELIAKQAKAHDVQPRIGIRVRLGAGGIGRWATSSGLRGKFGLSVSEVLQAVDYLKERDLLDSLQFLHCHIGSQIYDIRTVKYAVSEVTHLYAELVQHGAPMGMLDLGGGLGVDYDGTQTASPASSNYTVEQYALDVVHRIKSICDDAEIAPPHIFSESGRALVSHCTALVCEAVASRQLLETPNEALIARAMASDSVPQPLRDILEAYERMDAEGAAEADPLELLNDAAHAFEEAMSLFNLGYMDVTSRAVTEELYWCVGRRVLEMLDGEVPEELADLTATFADLYFVNMSVFQSLLDSWAIDQLFPIMPIHRLNERPTRSGVLVDISCDSDGRIEQFPSEDGPRGTLDLHELIPAPDDPDQEFEPYYLGVFLTGAYQETLGNVHNLFGDTHAVHVTLDERGRWRIDEVVEGDTVREVLDYVQYDADHMREELRKDAEESLAAGRLTLKETVSLRRFLDQGLRGYTYLE